MLNMVRNYFRSGLQSAGTVPGSLTLQKIQSQVETGKARASSAGFSNDEVAHICAHAKRLNNSTGYSYDVEPMCIVRRLGKVSTALVRLRAWEFGYDFVLLRAARNIDTSFNFGRTPVVIYRAHLGEDEYVYLETASSLLAAMRSLHHHYQTAAKHHLPKWGQ